MNRPVFVAENVKTDSCPGSVSDALAPPPGPVTACRSMLCGIVLDASFLRCSSTRSPSRTRMNEPGTAPPNVHAVYSTLSASRSVFSTTSRFTITFVGCDRVMGGGTLGACVSTATSWPVMSALGWGSSKILRPSSRADATLQNCMTSEVPAMSAAPASRVRQPGRRALDEPSSGDIDGFPFVLVDECNDAAFEQVRDRGMGERRTPRAVDRLPRIVRATGMGWIAGSAAEHAAGIQLHRVEELDHPAERDLPRWYGKSEPAGGTAGAGDKACLRDRIEHLRHVVARRPGGVGDLVRAQCARGLRLGQQQHGAKGVIGRERDHSRLGWRFASFSSGYQYIASRLRYQEGNASFFVRYD